MLTLNMLKNAKPCKVTLHGSSVEFTYLKKQSKEVTVDVSYVYLLAVETNSVFADQTSVSVHYVQPVVNKRLRVNTFTVQADLDTCNQLVSALQQQLAGRERPQRLAVIINPNSGKKQAEKVFLKKVQPLFTLCGIDTRVVVTKAPKQARDVLQTMDMADIDGVVTVGGDGLYCEVMTGLILRTQKDNGVDVHDPKAKVVRARLPLGIIPAGTGDVMVQYLHGTRDVMTSALRVVLGGTLPTNAVSVHQGGRLSAYSGLVLGFGLQGDMMADCERFRWMGHSRYNVIPIRTVLSRRSYDVEVEYEDEDTLEPRRLAQVMYGVDTYGVAKHERDGRLQHVFGADALTVYMTSKCSLGKHVQQLTKLKENEAGAFDYDFLHKARVQSYTVRLPHEPTVWSEGKRVLKGSYNINCDGEVLNVTHPEFMVNLHRHVIRVFGQAEV